MRKLSAKIYVFSIIYFFIIFSSINSYAQHKYVGDAYAEIWNDNIVWAGEGNFAYSFCIDAQGLISSDIDEVTNLVIQTNFGDINFENSINTSSAGRYGTGFLYSPEDITEIRIIKAIGVVNGKMLDLTNILNVREFIPVKIKIK
jgi:hypothetical protein